MDKYWILTKNDTAWVLDLEVSDIDQALTRYETCVEHYGRNRAKLAKVEVLDIVLRIDANLVQDPDRRQ